MSKIEDSVCSDIQTRSDFGAKKYGVTMERTDLNETQWLQHAYEEALDLAVYLKKILMEREKESLTLDDKEALVGLIYKAINFNIIVESDYYTSLAEKINASN